MPRAVSFSLLTLLTLSLSACREAEPDVVHYKKPRVDAEIKGRVDAGVPREKDRLLGVLVEGKERPWSFRLSGPTSAVAVHQDKFLEFVKSLKFGDKPPVTWKVPAGWQEIPGDGFRYATIKTNAEPMPLEVTIVPLDGGDLISNVNRWRGQLSLPKAAEDDLPAMTKPIEIDGRKGTLVDLEGRFIGKGKGPMMMPPQAAPPKQARDPSMKYQLPKGWSRVKAKNAMIREQFEAVDGPDKTEVTIVVMPGQGGGELGVLEMWRDQVKLPPVKDKKELFNDYVRVNTPMGVAGIGDLDNPKAPGNNRILGAMIPNNDVTYFIKLMGPSEAVGRQKARFDEFVKSFKAE